MISHDLVSRRARNRADRGFTLIELLVGCAILALLMVSLAGAFSSFTQVTGSSTKRLEANKQMRSVFDRLNLDLSSSIAHAGVTNQFFKNRRASGGGGSKNDAMVLLANVRSTADDARLAVVGYDVGVMTNAIDQRTQPTMVRSVQPLRWSDDISNLSLAPSAEQQPLTPGVFRMELAFLKTDGTIVPDPPAAEEIKAVICAVASLDENSLNLIEDQEALIDAFPDAVAGKPPLANWTVDNLATLPPLARENIRFQQRYFYLK